MTLVVEYLPAYRLAYKRAVGPYGAENEWIMKELKEWAKQRDLFQTGTILGIPQDNPQETLPENCRYDVALIIEDDLELDDSVSEGYFHEGTYAIFELPHTAEAIVEAWQSIFKLLAREGYEVRAAPIVERYRCEQIAQHLCEICVPVVSD